MSSSHPLLVRGASLPHLCFALGGDLFLSPFGEGISLRRYTSFGSEKLYPSGVGRQFNISQWKFILKLIPRIASALDEKKNDYFYHGPFSFQIAVRSARGSREVVFLQQNREDLILSKSQFHKLIEHGKEYLKRPLHSPLPPPSSANKASGAPSIAITLDENCKIVQQEETMASKSTPTPPSLSPLPPPPPPKKRKPKAEGGWTAPTIIGQRRKAANPRGGGGGGKQTKRSKAAAAPGAVASTSLSSLTEVAELVAPLPPKPVAPIPPRLLLCDKTLLPSPLFDEEEEEEEEEGSDSEVQWIERPLD